MLRNYTRFLLVPATLGILLLALSSLTSRPFSPGLLPPCPPPLNWEAASKFKFALQAAAFVLNFEFENLKCVLRQLNLFLLSLLHSHFLDVTQAGHCVTFQKPVAKEITSSLLTFTFAHFFFLSLD